MFEIKNVSMIYDMESDEKMYALDDFCLTLPDTGLVGIIGPSGSGKSTLMYVMSTLKTPTEGSVVYNGQELTGFSNRQRENVRRNEFGFVFQKHYLIPYMTAMDNVIVAAAGEKDDIKKKAAEYLKALGIKEREFGKRPSKLSGGQCQRVAIARALASNAKVLLADEPTGNLDENTAGEIIELLKRTAHELGKCVIVVTHSKYLAAQADEIIMIKDGCIESVTELPD